MVDVMPNVREFMDKSIEEAKKTGYAETILHRRRRIPDIYSTNKNKLLKILLLFTHYSLKTKRLCQ